MTNEAKRIVEALRMCPVPGYGCNDCPVYTPGIPCQNELNAADLIESLSAELEQVKRERDAAVADLKQAAIYLCCACRKYHRAIPGKSHHYCEEIGKREDFEGAIACGMFEWRGIKEDT